MTEEIPVKWFDHIFVMSHAVQDIPARGCGHWIMQVFPCYITKEQKCVQENSMESSVT